MAQKNLHAQALGRLGGKATARKYAQQQPHWLKKARRVKALNAARQKAARYFGLPS